MDTLFLCCDVGGTNTSIGLLKKDTTGHFTLLEVQRYKSQKIVNLTITLQETIALFKKMHTITKIPPLCISAAGPTDGETCAFSNLKSWTINRKEIENHLNIPVFLINDFSAIAYSLMVLDTNNTEQIVPISCPVIQSKNTQSSITNRTEIIKLAIGAGTGLGIAILHSKNKEVALIPTEGGWRHFSPSNELSFLYYQYLSKNASIPCYWEEAISGSRGIPSIYTFFTHTHFTSINTLLPTTEEQRSLHQLLLSAHQKDIAPIISTYALNGDSACIKIMKFWTMLYAKCCSETATMCLPQGGLYIAGGIAAKNLSFFTENNLFYTHFIQHSNQEVEKLLKQIPIYIIKDYYSSLYGDAYFLNIHVS